VTILNLIIWKKNSWSALAIYDRHQKHFDTFFLIGVATVSFPDAGVQVRGGRLCGLDDNGGQMWIAMCQKWLGVCNDVL
jgi:hypothetical protein